MLEFVAGILIMFSVLATAGFTRGRWLTQRVWVISWFSISATLALAIVLDFAYRKGTSELLYGLAAGYVLGVTVHTLHHAVQELTRSAPA